MALFALDKDLIFPPADLAEPDGLLAIGGDLSIERLLLSYQNGIFPWFEGDVPLWWSPDPRFVLLPAELKVSKSMQQLLKKNAFEFTINKAFDDVIVNCKNILRHGQRGTWITDEMTGAYLELHRQGYAHSAEVWKYGELAGGLYGVKLGKVFFGESMFSRFSNASKYAFICYVEHLQQQGIELIDCQVHTQHLESLGGKMIPRQHFLDLIKKFIAS